MFIQGYLVASDVIGCQTFLSIPQLLKCKYPPGILRYTPTCVGHICTMYIHGYLLLSGISICSQVFAWQVFPGILLPVMDIHGYLVLSGIPPPRPAPPFRPPGSIAAAAAWRGEKLDVETQIQTRKHQECE